jgi:hypothetical protein
MPDPAGSGGPSAVATGQQVLSVPGMALSLPERTYTRPDDDDDGDGEDDDGDGDNDDDDVADAMHKHVEGESSR